MSPAPKPTLERSPSSLDRVPLCWGHRGVRSLPSPPRPALSARDDTEPSALTPPPSRNQASAAFPENTLASFEAAIRDGAEGIESGAFAPPPFPVPPPLPDWSELVRGRPILARASTACTRVR